MTQVLDQPYDEIVAKARYLFWTKGYQDITVNDLAKHLEISPSLFYKKYSKDDLFIDALDSYVVSLSDPIMSQIRSWEEGINTFKGFYYSLIDALLDNTFPRGCLMVNTVVELNHEVDRLNLEKVYTQYFENMRKTYLTILGRAIELGEVKQANKKAKYADVLMGVIFGLSILYKIKTKEELRAFVDQQLAMIV